MNTQETTSHSDTQIFLRDLARTKHPLLNGIVRFNTRLAERVHTDTGSALSTFLPAQSSFAALRLGAVMPQIFGQETGAWVLDFRQPSRRIALLPPGLLIRLAHWYGLAVFRKETCGLIGREAVTELQQRVGEEGHLFALRRAELLTGNRVYAPDDPEENQIPLPERIERVGRQVIIACVYGTHACFSTSSTDTVSCDTETGRLLCARLAPTLPKGFLEPLVGAELPPALAVWPIVRKLVTKEIAPSWAPFFT